MPNTNNYAQVWGSQKNKRPSEEGRMAETVGFEPTVP